MNDTTAIHVEIAQRLFGWRWDAAAQLWRDPDGVYRDDATFRRRLPAYTTDPAATARVWQWLEGHRIRDLSFHYDDPKAPIGGILCHMTWTRTNGTYTFFFHAGATWPEALCRAALALAEALEHT